MQSMLEFEQIVSENLIEVATAPDLKKIRSPVSFTIDEFPEVLSQIQAQKSFWLAMKFDNEIFIVARGLLFCCKIK